LVFIVPPEELKRSSAAKFYQTGDRCASVCEGNWFAMCGRVFPRLAEPVGDAETRQASSLQ
jgi:hypothetical protein